MSDRLNNFVEDCTTKAVLEIYHFFTKEQIELLKKLDVSIEDKKYTIYEFDVIDGKVRNYFKSQFILSEKGISKEEYTQLLNVLNEIARKNQL